MNSISELYIENYNCFFQVSTKVELFILCSQTSLFLVVEKKTFVEPTHREKYHSTLKKAVSQFIFSICISLHLSSINLSLFTKFELRLLPQTAEPNLIFIQFDSIAADAIKFARPGDSSRFTRSFFQCN